MIKENLKKGINSILYVRLPCPKIWPVSLVYLADHIHKECPNVKQRILDLSLVEPEDESKTLIKTIEEFNPQAIAFSLRVIQPFSPEEGDPSLINAFNFYFSRNPIKKIKSALFGAKSVVTYQNRTKKTLALINEASNKFGDCQILIGGPAFSVFWNFVMPKINKETVGVVGEAENALLKIIKGLPLEGERFVWQENGSAKCGVQKQFVDLSKQTPVDFSYIESIYPGFKEYLDEPIGVQTKRGCPFNCLYCLYNYIEGKKVRYRNPQVVGQEIETLNKEYGIKKIWFCDSQFYPAKKDFAICEKTLDQIIKRKLDIQWTSYMRIEHITKNIAEKMLASGVSDFELSINSGSQKVINKLKLGFRLEKLFEGLKILRDAGFEDKKIRLNLSLNSPGETKETLLETIQTVKKIKEILGENITPYIYFLAIQPKTALAEYAIERKLLPPTWDPLALNPLIIKKLIYNPPPLRKIIGRAVVDALAAEEPLGPGVLKRLEKELS